MLRIITRSAASAVLRRHNSLNIAPIEIVGNTLATRMQSPPSPEFRAEYNQYMFNQPSQDKLFFNKHFGYFCEKDGEAVKGNGFFCQRGNATNALYYSFETQYNEDRTSIKSLKFEISPHKKYGEGRATLISINEYSTPSINWVELKRVHSMLEWTCEAYVFVRMMFVIAGSSATTEDFTELVSIMQK